MRDPFFKIAHRKVKGEWLTKSQYQDYVNRKEAKDVLKADEKMAGIRKRIGQMKDTPHSLAIPVSLRAKPSRRELEIGIPECCNGTPMQVSAFTEGIWFCPDCKKTRLR